jgi:hypothetical protein
MLQYTATHWWSDPYKITGLTEASGFLQTAIDHFERRPGQLPSETVLLNVVVRLMTLSVRLTPLLDTTEALKLEMVNTSLAPAAVAIQRQVATAPRFG